MLGGFKILYRRFALANASFCSLHQCVEVLRLEFEHMIQTGERGFIFAGATFSGPGFRMFIFRLPRKLPQTVSEPALRFPTAARIPSGRGQLPRIDLPYGSLRWPGTSGDRAVRPTDLDIDKPSPDYLKLFAPAWVAALAPAPLTSAEQAAADQLD